MEIRRGAPCTKILKSSFKPVLGKTNLSISATQTPSLSPPHLLNLGGNNCNLFSLNIQTISISNPSVALKINSSLRAAIRSELGNSTNPKNSESTLNNIMKA